MSDTNQRIVRLAIDNPSVVRYQPDVEREIDVAIFDLIEANQFRPEAAFFGGAPPQGPYAVTLRIQESRVAFDIDREDGAKVGAVLVSVQPLRRLIREYFIVCENYYEAIRTAMPAQIEAIDMGRRALHNDGSERLRLQLAGKVEIDQATARRLFTLICALHIRA